MCRLAPSLVAFSFVLAASATHADIFQWEYINPANASQGKRQSTMLVPDGAGVDAVPGANLSDRNLTKAYLIGKDLTDLFAVNANLSDADLSQSNLSNGRFQDAKLIGANFTNADVRGADFKRIVLTTPIPISTTGLTAPQLYSTASYQSGDLSGIRLSGNNLSGWNFTGQNLTNADLLAADVSNAVFTGATIQGADLRAYEFTAAQLVSTASFQARDLTGVRLGSIGLGLTGVDLSGQIIKRADLSGTGLTPSQLYSTASFQARDLSGVNLQWIDLTNVDLSGQIIKGANLSDTHLTSSQLYSTASYQAHDLSGVVLSVDRGCCSRPQPTDLTGWNFAGQDLRGAGFRAAMLEGTDFAGADVRGASFYASNLKPEQLYSTASYQAVDLSGIVLSSYFPEANFAGMNLTNGQFNHQLLIDAVLHGADLRGVVVDCLGGLCYSPPQPPLSDNLDDVAQSSNTIHPNGHIDGVQCTSGQTLSIRDYDGGGYFASGPVSITVDDYFTNTGGALRIVLEADAWDSTISFAPGIPVALGGTLELTFADDVHLASQVGRSFDLFDWTGVNPTGMFVISSPYAWDLSNLYTTGEVTLTAVPEQATIASLIVGGVIPLLKRRRIASVAPNSYRKSRNVAFEVRAKL